MPSSWTVLISLHAIAIPNGVEANPSFIELLPALGGGAYPRLTAELQRERDSVSEEFQFALDTTIRGLAAS